MLLASDVGGTKTLLGLFSAQPRTASPIEVGEFVTLDYDGLEPMVREFLGAWKVDPRTITAACIGVAGAVTDQVARLTNVPWLVDAEAVATGLGLARVEVINDLEALAYACRCSSRTSWRSCSRASPIPGGNAAVIAAGTGMGIGMLHNVHGRFVPFASEGGHADFAARTPRELELVAELTRDLRPRRRRARHLGPGAGQHLSVHAPGVRHRTDDHAEQHRALSPVHRRRTGPHAKPICRTHLHSRRSRNRCPRCVEAFDMFISAYGSEAGNLALRALATAGVYIGGGIAPKILPALESGSSSRHSGPRNRWRTSSPRCRCRSSSIPTAGLLGAAVYALGWRLRRKSGATAPTGR